MRSSARPGEKGPTLGEDVASFAFSRDGGAIAFLAGVVPGTDPILKEDVVIYSAHWDHLGKATPAAAARRMLQAFHGR